MKIKSIESASEFYCIGSNNLKKIELYQPSHNFGDDIVYLLTYENGERHKVYAKEWGDVIIK